MDNTKDLESFTDVTDESLEYAGETSFISMSVGAQAMATGCGCLAKPSAF